MINVYKKLVTVAEDTVTAYNQHVGDVYELSVSVQGNQGCITVGVFGIVGSTYYPDENQYMPEYGMDYNSFHYELVDGEWVNKPKQVAVPVENDGATVQENFIDDLPF